MSKNKIGRPKNIGFYVKNNKSWMGQLGLMTGIKNGIQPNKVDEELEKYQDKSKYIIERYYDKVMITEL